MALLSFQLFVGCTFFDDSVAFVKAAKHHEILYTCPPFLVPVNTRTLMTMHADTALPGTLH